jgi:hypothetical protein
MEAPQNLTRIDDKWIYAADPDADAAEAIKNQDYRFVGVNSHNVIIPGFDIDCEISHESIRIIEGTSHFYPSYSIAKFNAIARIYAEYYNVRMKVHFEEQDRVICE